MRCACSRSRSGFSAEQRLDLADDLVVAAGGEVRVDRELRGARARSSSSRRISRVGERLVGEVGERIAAEQRERLARRARRAPAAAARDASETSRSKRQTSTSSRSIRSS